MAPPRTSNNSPAGPLDGLVVVDLSRYLPGPLAAQILASLGARVIKVEEPSLGDPVRLAPPRKEGASALAAPLLAGVESVALNLKKPAAVAVLERLLETADVLLETLRPGGLAALGLDPEDLRKRFPRLVLCSLSGWGQDGPHAHRAGHDLTYQAVAGSLAPTAAVPALPSADVLGAWSAVTAVLAALHRRQSFGQGPGRATDRDPDRGSGEGSWIDASLYDAAVYSNLVAWAAEAGRPHAVGTPHDLAGALACYRLYQTQDGGTVALALLERHFWRRFVKALVREGLGTRDLGKLHQSRSPEAHRAVAAVMRTRTRSQWERFFATHDLPAEPLLCAAEAQVHAQAETRGLLSQGPDGLPRLAFPARFDQHRPAAAAEVPDLGQHTQALLDELGIEDLPRLRARAGIGKRRSLKRWLAGLLLRG